MKHTATAKKGAPNIKHRGGEDDKSKKSKKPLSIERLREVIPKITSNSRRRQFAAKSRSAVRKEQSKNRKARKVAEKRGEEVVRGVPKTIENLRNIDETIVEANDDEIKEADEADEFASYFSGQRTPKLLITTCRSASKRLKSFVHELTLIIPNLFFYPRCHYRIKSIVKYATNNEFTDVLVLTERLNKPNGLYISHLPDGPTSFFKLTNVKLAQDMKGSAAMTTHDPEILLNNFTTRLGRRVARQLVSLFPQKPDFQGRRAICFHNQRDFIFLRHHRYIFNHDGSKCSIQEIGPRMTMKLHSMQTGTFDPKGELLEYRWKAEDNVDRKKVFM